jgi:hypothetical protein
MTEICDLPRRFDRCPSSATACSRCGAKSDRQPRPDQWRNPAGVTALPFGSTFALPTQPAIKSEPSWISSPPASLRSVVLIAQLLALRDADNHPGRGARIDVPRGEFINDCSDADRVDADPILFRQQSAAANVLDNIGNLDYVVADAFDDRQVTVGVEVAQTGRDVLAALKHALVRPGVAPMQPLARFRLDLRLARAAENRKAEKVVEAAAIDSDRHDLAARQQLVERERRVGVLLPMERAGPLIGLEREPNLDVEVL